MAQKRDWHNSGADCCSPCSTCLLSWCLPCITYGRTHHRLRQRTLTGYSCCNGSCIGFAVLTHCGLSWIMAMLQRSEIRGGYHLTGNGCKDCLCACCCLPCDLTQQDKEVEFREAEKAQLIVNQQPGKQAAMGYQPQPQYQSQNQLQYQQHHQPHYQQQQQPQYQQQY